MVLERMVHGGVCLAREKSGRLALVRGGIPGERVMVELVEISGVLRGHVTEVLEPSSDRVTGSDHPGLDLAYVSYARQLELKREIVDDSLQRAFSSIGISPEKRPKRRDFAQDAGEDTWSMAEEVVPSPQQWGYRNTVQPVVTRDRQLGYRQPLTHDVVQVDTDPAANTAIRAAWTTLVGLGIPKGVREVVFRGNDHNEVLVSLISSGSSRLYLSFAHELLRKGIKGVEYAEFDPRGRFRRGAEKLAGERRILQRFGDFDLTVTTSSFAQPNAAAAGLLYQEIRRLTPFGMVANDLYSGGGAIAFHLAEKFDEIVAYEIDRFSIQRGKSDADRLGIGNVAFVRGDVKTSGFGERADLITADPPRAGLNKEVREAIDKSRTRQLLYVACDPATWARDVADFTSRGWKLELVRPYDFYPHTHHIELLSRLSR